MHQNVKSGIYSPISLAAIERIVRGENKNPYVLLAYIVLARYCGQKAVGDYGKNMVTGAGGNAVRKALKIGSTSGKTLVQLLEKIEIISKSPSGLFAGQCAATYVMKYSGDIQIPHALVDGLNGVTGIMRLFENKYDQPRPVITVAIIALVHCYRQHDMFHWGGVNHSALTQEWSMKSVLQEGGDYKIKARRGANKNRCASPSFFADVMRSLNVESADFDAWRPTFDVALCLLGESGLVYEAVTLLDNDRKPILPVRINDFHAARSDSEPSYIEDISGAGFYTQANNPTGEEEGLRFLLPVDPTAKGWSLTGVTRLRFRGAAAETALGLKRDADNLAMLKARLMPDDVGDLAGIE